MGLTNSCPAARLKVDFINIFFLLFRDISFLYDVKYVKGEPREGILCPPRSKPSLQSHDSAIVPHKVKREFEPVGTTTKLRGSMLGRLFGVRLHPLGLASPVGGLGSAFRDWLWKKRKKEFDK